MLIHLNLKPCNCDLCAAAFRTVKHVVQHKKVSHDPSGAYKCPNCTCQFKTHKSLAGHITTWHTPNPQAFEESLIRSDLLILHLFYT
jgi:uncharacterized C2H2 Zn-finger protein